MKLLFNKIGIGIITLIFILSCTSEEVIFQNGDDFDPVSEKTFKVSEKEAQDVLAFAN